MQAKDFANADSSESLSYALQKSDLLVSAVSAKSLPLFPCPKSLPIPLACLIKIMILDKKTASVVPFEALGAFLDFSMRTKKEVSCVV